MQPIFQIFKRKDMNFLNILQELGKVDKEVHQGLTPRRKAIRQFFGFGSKVAFASLPFAFGSVLKKAHAQTATGNTEEVFQFVLLLEYLEADFYTLGLAAVGLIPAGAAREAITNVLDHENKHIAFLTATLESLEVAPVSKPTFDFTGGKGVNAGPFADVFSNYNTFLAIAQALEDTGVRAYKGQIPELLGIPASLTAALNIHSVEARHASHIRQMRKRNGVDIKPWITGKESVPSTVIQPAYDGEETDIQGGIKLTGISGLPISLTAATESFDQPLTKEQVLAIIDPFIV